MQSTPETRIQELHLTLPADPTKPVAKYKMAVLAGNILYVSGHGPLKNTKGKVGKDLTLEQGKECARDVGINILGTVRHTLGSLNKVKRLVKTLGMVNATPEFRDHPKSSRLFGADGRGVWRGCWSWGSQCSRHGLVACGYPCRNRMYLRSELNHQLTGGWRSPKFGYAARRIIVPLPRSKLEKPAAKSPLPVFVERERGRRQKSQSADFRVAYPCSSKRHTTPGVHEVPCRR